MTISKKSFDLILSDAYVNCLDLEQLEEKEPIKIIDVKNVIEFLLYNIFKIEIV